MTRKLSIFLILLVGMTTVAQAEENVIAAPIANLEAQAGIRTLIDVRLSMEWRKTGVPVGAQEISIHDRGGVSFFVAKVIKMVGGKKNTPIALICARGVRSSKAAAVLAGAGFTNIRDVREGVLGNQKDGPGWLKHKLPTQPCRNC